MLHTNTHYIVFNLLSSILFSMILSLTMFFDGATYSPAATRIEIYIVQTETFFQRKKMNEEET